jgi:hypothetical protein
MWFDLPVLPPRLQAGSYTLIHPNSPGPSLTTAARYAKLSMDILYRSLLVIQGDREVKYFDSFA